MRAARPISGRCTPTRLAAGAVALALAAALAGCGGPSSGAGGGGRQGSAGGESAAGVATQAVPAAPASGATPAPTAALATPAPLPIPDACALLTGDDVAQISGEISGSLSSTLDDAVGRDPSRCSYPLSGGAPPQVVSLEVRRAPTAEQAIRLFQIAESGLRSITRGAPFAEVARLGDGAFWIGGQLAQLHVRSGTIHLVFTVQTRGDQLAAARQLAGKALDRLAAAARPAAGARDGAPPAPTTPAAPPAGAPAGPR